MSAKPDLEASLRLLTRELRDAQLASRYPWTSARCLAMSMALAVRLRLDGQTASVETYDYTAGSGTSQRLAHVAVRVGEWLADPSREQFYAKGPGPRRTEPLVALVERAADVEGSSHVPSNELDIGPAAVSRLVHLIATELAKPVDDPGASATDANLALAWETILTPLHLAHLWVHGLALMAGDESQRCCCCDRQPIARIDDSFETSLCDAHEAEWLGGPIAPASLVTLRCAECDGVVWDYGFGPNRGIALFCTNDHATALKDAVVRVAEPGRNDPCPCGSGRKAKRCCFRSVQ